MINLRTQELEELAQAMAPLLVWACVLVVVVVVLACVVVPWAFWSWWFRGDKVNQRVHRLREKIGRELDVTIKGMSRDGSIRIAGGETEKWQRDGLDGELKNVLNLPVRVKVNGGIVHIVELKNLPEKVTGRPSYDPQTGQLILGVDVGDGQPCGFSLNQGNGVLIGALPGGGKTVLIKQIIDAIGPHGDVVEVWKKGDSVDDPSVDERLSAAVEEMKDRNRSEIDFWGKDAGKYRAKVLIIDEMSSFFRAGGVKKISERRKEQVKRLVSEGRSAGIVVVLASQRLSTDDVPSGIRNVCKVSVCGPVRSEQEAEMVLGARPEQGDPSPVGLKPRRFVVADDEGPWREMHAFERPQGRPARACQPARKR